MYNALDIIICEQFFLQTWLFTKKQCKNYPFNYFLCFLIIIIVIFVYWMHPLMVK